MAVFVFLWPYLSTTKLRCLQKNNIGHTNLQRDLLLGQLLNLLVEQLQQCLGQVQYYHQILPTPLLFHHFLYLCHCYQMSFKVTRTQFIKRGPGKAECKLLTYHTVCISTDLNDNERNNFLFSVSGILGIHRNPRQKYF